MNFVHTYFIVNQNEKNYFTMAALLLNRFIDHPALPKNIDFSNQISHLTSITVENSPCGCFIDFNNCKKDNGEDKVMLENNPEDICNIGLCATSLLLCGMRIDTLSVFYLGDAKWPGWPTPIL